MEEVFTSNTSRQCGLADIYYMSCLESVNRTHSEIKVSNAPTKFFLAITMATSINTYAAETKNHEDFNEVRTELIANLVRSSNQLNFLTPNSNQKISIEVNKSPSVGKISRKEKVKQQQLFEQMTREQMLLQSYIKNRGEVNPSYSSMWTMRMANTILSELPYEDSMLQYDKYDDVWQYNLYFPHDMEMSVSVYVEEENVSEVDYNIYHEGELVVANVMPLPKLVKKMKSLISKVEKNA